MNDLFDKGNLDGQDHEIGLQGVVNHFVHVDRRIGQFLAMNSDPPLWISGKWDIGKDRVRDAPSVRRIP